MSFLLLTWGHYLTTQQWQMIYPTFPDIGWKRGKAALFPISSAMCRQVTLPYLEFCLRGVFACTALHLASILARSCMQSSRGAGRREASLQLGKATCIICQQRMVRSCHMYITFLCELPGGGIWLKIHYSLRCSFSHFFSCPSDLLLAPLYLLPSKMKKKSKISLQRCLWLVSLPTDPKNA